MKLVVRLIVNMVAIWVAVQLLEGVSFDGTLWNWVILAVIFGLVNAIIRPLIKLLTLPINLLTLGLFTLVINALMFWLTSWLYAPLRVDGFIAALLGSIVISIVSILLSWLLPDD